jgi:hypothetical protein
MAASPPPGPLPSAGPGQPGGLLGGGVTPDARAPGSVPGPVLTEARVVLCAQRVLQPRTLPQLNSDGTVYRHDAVHCVSAATGGPKACPNSSWPLPPGRRLVLGLPLVPSRSSQRMRGRARLALTPEPRAHAPGWP